MSQRISWSRMASSRAAALNRAFSRFSRRPHLLNHRPPDLLKRFREHTTKLFERHGMKNLAYWTPLDEPAKSNTLIYVLAHASREAAAASWKAFQADPEWVEVRDKSEANGKIVEKVDSTYMTKTDFSNFGW